MYLMELMRNGRIAQTEEILELLLNHIIEAFDECPSEHEQTTAALVDAVIASYLEAKPNTLLLSKRDAESVMHKSFCIGYRYVMKMTKERLIDSEVLESWPTFDIECIYKSMPKHLAQRIGVAMGVHEAKRTKALQRYFEAEQAKQTKTSGA